MLRSRNWDSFAMPDSRSVPHQQQPASPCPTLTIAACASVRTLVPLGKIESEPARQHLDRRRLADARRPSEDEYSLPSESVLRAATDRETGQTRYLRIRSFTAVGTESGLMPDSGDTPCTASYSHVLTLCILAFPGARSSWHSYQLERPHFTPISLTSMIGA